MHQQSTTPTKSDLGRFRLIAELGEADFQLPCALMVD